MGANGSTLLIGYGFTPAGALESLDAQLLHEYKTRLMCDEAKRNYFITYKGECYFVKMYEREKSGKRSYKAVIVF